MCKSKYYKKIISFFILSILVLNLFNIEPVFSFANSNNEKDYLTFVKDASRLIEKNWKDNFFSSITFTENSSVMIVDREEINTKPPVVKKGEVLLPLLDIAQIIDAEIVTDKNKKIKIIENDEELNIPTTDTNSPMISVDDVEEILNLEVDINENEIKLTSPYQMKQLVVQTKSGKKLNELYGAIQYACDGKGTYLLQYATIKDTKKAHSLFENAHDIEYALPNKFIQSTEKRTTSKFTKSKPRMFTQYFLENFNSLFTPVANETAVNSSSVTLTNRWGAERISADMFKDYIKENDIDNSVIVAVADSGIDLNHPFLSDRIIEGGNFSSSNLIHDANGHGTHVSGIVVDRTPDNVKIMPLKVLDDKGEGSDLTVNLGIRHAVDNGADVINLSLGGECNSQNCIMKRGLDYAFEKDVLVISASGNENKNTSNFCPAKFNETMTVAASDRTDKRASFSNYGKAVDIAAPGTSINSSLPGNTYGNKNGTSTAAPHVSAAAAMLIADDENISPQTIRTLLQESAKHPNNIARDDYFGVGILDLSIYLESDNLISDLEFSQPEINRIITDSIQEELTVTIKPANAVRRHLKITVSDENIAEYTKGILTIKTPGTAVITAQSENGIQTQSILTAQTRAVTSISINTTPKTSYFLEQELDLSVGNIKLNYNDGTSKIIPLSDNQIVITGYDKNKEGTQTLTVRYGEFTTNFNVTVAPAPAPTPTPKPTPTPTPIPPKIYVVTFKNGSNTTSQKVETGKLARVPRTPSKKGYTFTGWFTQNTGGKIFNFNTAITRNITLHSRFEKNPVRPSNFRVKRHRTRRRAVLTWRGQSKTRFEIRQRINNGKWKLIAKTKSGASSWTSKNLRKRRYFYKIRAVKTINKNPVRSTNTKSKRITIK